MKRNHVSAFLIYSPPLSEIVEYLFPKIGDRNFILQHYTRVENQIGTLNTYYWGISWKKEVRQAAKKRESLEGVK